MTRAQPDGAAPKAIKTTWKGNAVGDYSNPDEWTAGIPGPNDAALFPYYVGEPRRVVRGVGLGGIKSVGTWVSGSPYLFEIVEDFTFMDGGMDFELATVEVRATTSFRNASRSDGTIHVHPGAELRFEDNSMNRASVHIQRGGLVRDVKSPRAVSGIFWINEGGTLDVSDAWGDRPSFRIQGAGLVRIGDKMFQPVVWEEDGKFPGVIAGEGSVYLGSSFPAAFSFLGLNTYAGGTTLANTSELSIAQDAGLGAATGPLNFDGGTLRLLSSFNLSATRPITVAFQHDAVFDTNGFDMILPHSIEGGEGGLTKIGAGTLTLGAVNSYLNGTKINGGTLAVAADAALGAASSGLSFDGGGLRLLSGFDLDAARPVTLDSRGGTVDTNGFATTVTQGISGSGRLIKAGNGIMTLVGANSYGGGTTISAGTLQVGDGGTAGSIVGPVSNEGRIIYNRSDVHAYDGAISGSGRFEQLGRGTTVLTGANSYVGGTVITFGTLQIGNGGTNGSIVGDVLNNATLAFDRSDALVFTGAITGPGAVDQRGRGTTILTAGSSHGGGTTISAGTLQIGDGGTSGSISGRVVNNGTLAVKRRDAFSFASPVSGSGAVRQIGSGTLTLTLPSSYRGGTFFDNGSIAVASDINLGASLGGLTFGGGALRLLASFVLGSGRPVTFNGPSGIIDTNGHDTTLPQHAVGAGGLVKKGPGTLTLSGVNFYTGGTAINGGTLALPADACLGAPNGGLSFDGGRLLLQARFDLPATRAVTLNEGGGIFDTNGFDMTVSKGITGRGGLTKDGAGVLTLLGINAYDGPTVVNGGTLRIANGVLPKSANVIVNDGALDFSDSPYRTIEIGSLSGSGGTISITGTLVVNVARDVTLMASIVGDGKLVKKGKGTLTLAGANTYTGRTVVEAGGLVVVGSLAGDVALGPGGTFGGDDRISGSVVRPEQ